MPSDDQARVLLTIAGNIKLARAFTRDLAYEAFADDLRTQYAVTRCLEIVSEASRRIPEEVKSRWPNVPWLRIARSGNVYRHEYEDVSPIILWETVAHHLDDIEEPVIAELSRP